MSAFFYYLTLAFRWVQLHLGCRECDVCGEIKRSPNALAKHKYDDHGDLPA